MESINKKKPGVQLGREFVGKIARVCEKNLTSHLRGYFPD